MSLELCFVLLFGILRTCGWAEMHAAVTLYETLSTAGLCTYTLHII